MYLDKIEYPEHIFNVREIKAMSSSIDDLISKIATDIDSLNNNLAIETSDEIGIARRERILGIEPLDTDTLEERRYRVLVKWYDSFPYTEKDLRARLERLCSGGIYTMDVDYENMIVFFKLAIENSKNYNEVKDLLDELVPLHIYIKMGLVYQIKADEYAAGIINVGKNFTIGQV